MKKHIAEELPQRKFKQAEAGAAPANNEKGDDKKNSDPQDKVKQAVYDIRYRARREELPLQTAFTQYMSNSSMGAQEKALVRAKLFGESYDIESYASTSIAKALYQVFVEKKEQEISEEDILNYFREEQIVNTKGERKYKVEVVGTDGRSYVRYATREKINDLRLNPNIKSVEMTDYGTPYEGEKSKGQQTAAVKAGKDWDGDGKVETSSKEHAGVVHNAIQRKKGGTPDGQDTRKESVEFIGEVKDEDETREENEKIDVMKKGKKNKCDVLPSLGKTDSVMASYVPAGAFVSESEMSEGQLMFHQFLYEKAVSQNQQQLAGMALAYLRGEMPEASDEVKKMAKMGEKKLRDFAKTKHKGLPEKVEEAKEEGGCDDDRRGEYAEKNVIKNRIRAALGVKNPIILAVSKEEKSVDGEQIDEFLDALNPFKWASDTMKKDRRDVTTGSGAAKPGTIKGNLQNRRKQEAELMKQSYELEGEMVSEEESDRESDRAREGGDWRSRSQRPSVRRRRPSVADDPRYGSMSDSEWARSSHNPANKRRRYGR
jgi:hypothetical protein